MLFAEFGGGAAVSFTLETNLMDWE